MNLRKRTRRLILAALLLLVVGVVYWCWPDRNLARAKELQKELFSPNARSMPAEQRREKWQQFREVQKQLSPAQRELLFAESRKRQQMEMARYFRMSPQEKTRYLDTMIKRSEKMRQRGAPGPIRAGRGEPGPVRAGSGAPRRNASSTSSGRGTIKAREERRQRRLDSSTPAARAMFSQFMKDLRTRRAQLGLPPRGRGFGPPR